MEKRYVLGVFVRPLWKDWAFWHAIAWALGIGLATYIDPEGLEGDLPLWGDVVGVGLTAFILIGWPVAGARRLIRWVVMKQRKLREPTEGSSLKVSNGMPSPEAPTQVIASHSPVERPKTPAQKISPVPLSGYSGEGLREIQSLTQARSEFPYPVARAARAVQTTQDPLEQYQYLIDLGEHLTLTLGMLSASWLRSYSPADQALQRLHEAFHLRGVSQGHWLEVVRAAERAMAKSANGVPGFVEGVRVRRGGEGLIKELNVVLSERNQAAHGARPHNRAEAAVRTAALTLPITEAVDYAAFLTETPWVLVESVSLRRQDRRWSVRLRRAMGDHPDFDVSNDVLDSPLVNDTFYVMAHPEPLDLTPMLVMRYCEQCRQPEVCHADRVDEQAGVCLKSFARGHQVFDRDLVGDVDTLVAG